MNKFRSWVIDITVSLMNLAGRIAYANATHPIGWRDHLRWWMEGQLQRVFGWAWDGSAEEIEAVYRSEVPLEYMSTRQRAVLTLPRSEYSAYCVSCSWNGLWSECPKDRCPDCGEGIYLDPFTPEWSAARTREISPSAQIGSPNASEAA